MREVNSEDSESHGKGRCDQDGGPIDIPCCPRDGDPIQAEGHVAEGADDGDHKGDGGGGARGFFHGIAAIGEKGNVQCAASNT